MEEYIRTYGYNVLEHHVDTMDMFEHQGVTITNPFVDETGNWSVDPINHYGIDNIVKAIVDISAKAIPGGEK